MTDLRGISDTEIRLNFGLNWVIIFEDIRGNIREWYDNGTSRAVGGVSECRTSDFLVEW